MNPVVPTLHSASSRHVRVHSPATINALADALRAEERLLVELTGVLRRQREAIAADDLDTLDDSVFATHRVLLTLGEARKQRRAINHLLGEGDDLNLSKLDDVFADAPPPSIKAAAGALAETARILHREVDMNRHVLRRAIDSGDQLVRALAGVAEEPVVSYEPRATPSASSIIFDRRV